ncbi:Arf GTPase activating protein, variant 2 [Balamuthia mandrillaris]
MLDDFHYQRWRPQDDDAEVEYLLCAAHGLDVRTARNHSVLYCVPKEAGEQELECSFIGAKQDPSVTQDMPQATLDILSKCDVWNRFVQGKPIRTDFETAVKVIYICFVEETDEGIAFAKLEQEKSKSKKGSDEEKKDSGAGATSEKQPKEAEEWARVKAYVGQARTLRYRWGAHAATSGTTSHLRDVMRCLEGATMLDVDAVKRTALCDRAIARSYLDRLQAVKNEVDAMRAKKAKNEAMNEKQRAKRAQRQQEKRNKEAEEELVKKKLAEEASAQLKAEQHDTNEKEEKERQKGEKDATTTSPPKRPRMTKEERQKMRAEAKKLKEIEREKERKKKEHAKKLQQKEKEKERQKNQKAKEKAKQKDEAWVRGEERMYIEACRVWLFVLEENVEDLDARETYWIERLRLQDMRVGYNVQSGRGENTNNHWSSSAT